MSTIVCWTLQAFLVNQSSNLKVILGTPKKQSSLGHTAELKKGQGPGQFIMLEKQKENPIKKYLSTVKQGSRGEQTLRVPG